MGCAANPVAKAQPSFYQASEQALALASASPPFLANALLPFSFFFFLFSFFFFIFLFLLNKYC
jgi:hypothetical protein